MTKILSVGTALPEYQYTCEEVRALGRTWLRDQPEQHALFDRFLASSQTKRRFFSIPGERILELTGLKERAGFFEEIGPALGCRALQNALDLAHLSPADVSAVVFTSCSCPAIPSIDAVIISTMGIAPTVTRIPIFQHGCAGGVVGLGIAQELARKGGVVALLSVELCSLVFHKQKPSAAELVGSALFADGAACALIGENGEGLTFCDRESFLVPNSRHLMGYGLEDDGFHLKLDRELPSVLSAVAPERVHSFLGRNRIAAADVKHWLFHPGGIKILNFLESAFTLRPEQASWSRDILSSVGNVSSATVLFVLDAFLRSNVMKEGEYAVMLGVGPGLTLEMILFRKGGSL